MSVQYTRPSEIERASFSIIREELAREGVVLLPENRPVVERVIHTTADFDFARNLVFTENAVAAGIAVLRDGADIVTDTNMAQRPAAKCSREACKPPSDPAMARDARETGTTRAAASVRYAAQKHPGAVFAVGNAPTALLELERQMENGLRPAMIVGVPVGFVNVVDAKERILACCSRCGVPAIVARGRKGGSNVAAAILNALIYAAADMLDPAQRGWN